MVVIRDIYFLTMVLSVVMLAHYAARDLRPALIKALKWTFLAFYAAVVVLVLVNHWTGVLYTVTPDGGYIRSPANVIKYTKNGGQIIVRIIRKHDFHGKRVLLVEDDHLDQEIAQAILQDVGFDVSIADGGDVAVERLQDAMPGDYDLVLMDIQMPKMDGYTATRQIRTLPGAVANVPIVAMTANAFEEDKQKAIRAGMNAHISKPIEADKLMETLSGILQ